MFVCDLAFLKYRKNKFTACKIFLIGRILDKHEEEEVTGKNVGDTSHMESDDMDMEIGEEITQAADSENNIVEQENDKMEDNQNVYEEMDDRNEECDSPDKDRTNVVVTEADTSGSVLEDDPDKDGQAGVIDDIKGEEELEKYSNSYAGQFNGENQVIKHDEKETELNEEEQDFISSVTEDSKHIEDMKTTSADLNISNDNVSDNRLEGDGSEEHSVSELCQSTEEESKEDMDDKKATDTSDNWNESENIETEEVVPSSEAEYKLDDADKETELDNVDDSEDEIDLTKPLDNVNEEKRTGSIGDTLETRIKPEEEGFHKGVSSSSDYADDTASAVEPVQVCKNFFVT